MTCYPEPNSKLKFTHNNMQRTESLVISATDLIGAISDTVPTYNGFGPLLELNAGDYALRTAVKLPNDWDGGPIKLRVNHARQDSDTVSAGVVVNLITPNTVDSVGDSGTPVALDLSGSANKLTTSGHGDANGNVHGCGVRWDMDRVGSH